MQNFMMVWSRNQDMKSGETCSFLAKGKDVIRFFLVRSIIIIYV